MITGSLVQTSHGQRCTFEAHSDTGVLYARASMPNFPPSGEGSYESGMTRATLSFDAILPRNGSPVIENGVQIGFVYSEMAYARQGGSGILTNDPSDNQFRGWTYQFYTVVPERGRAFTIGYRVGADGGEVKVAQVEIGMTLVNCCMTYRFAITDLEAFDATMLRMIFMTQYCDDHVGEIIMKGKHKLFAFKSKKADLLARFDPAWGA